MTAETSLVVAPYNNQVGLIRHCSRPGPGSGRSTSSRGSEAPVVIYSMTSSSVADAPRGASASSTTCTGSTSPSPARRRMAIVVLSPELLDAAVSNPEQLRQVNALCRLHEEAGAAAAAGQGRREQG